MSNRDAENTTNDRTNADAEDDVSGYGMGMPGIPTPVPGPSIDTRDYTTDDVTKSDPSFTDPPPTEDPGRMPPGTSEGTKDPAQW